MKIVARTIGGLLLLAAGLVLAGVGGGGGGALQPLGAFWYGLSPASLNLVQAVIERYIWEALWDPLLIGLLQWPAALVFGLSGAAVLAASFLRRPARKNRPGGGSPDKAEDPARDEPST